MATRFGLAIACFLGGVPCVYAQSTDPPIEAEGLSKASAAREHFTRARAHYDAGQYVQALAELEEAHALDPAAKDLVYNLGIVSERLGRFEDALRYFREYLTRDLTSAERGRAEGLVRRIEGAKRTVPPPAQPAPAPALPPPAQAPPRPERGRIDGWTIAAGSLAIVSLGTGTYFAVRAVDERPSSGFVTGRDGSYASFEDQARSAHDQAVMADVALGVGVIAAAATFYLYFARTKTPASNAAARPVAGFAF